MTMKQVQPSHCFASHQWVSRVKTARNLSKHAARFVFLLVIVVIVNVAGLLLDIEKNAVIAHQLSVGISSIVKTATGPRYVRYILITTLFTQLIWENTLLQSCDTINRHQCAQGVLYPAFTRYDHPDCMEGICSTQFIHWNNKHCLSRSTTDTCHSLVWGQCHTKLCLKMWQFNVALIDRKGALIHHILLYDSSLSSWPVLQDEGEI